MRLMVLCSKFEDRMESEQTHEGIIQISDCIFLSANIESMGLLLEPKLLCQ